MIRNYDSIFERVRTFDDCAEYLMPEHKKLCSHLLPDQIFFSFNKNKYQ